MSRQIAVFLALGGYDTVIWNRARRAHVPDALREEASRWGADYASLDRSIVLTDDLNELADSSLVIESVLEDPRVKSRILAEVSSLVAEDTIITTNTSALSIETLSTVVRRPERFHGLHFLNPLQKVRFVEVSPCRATSRATLDRTIELLGRWSLDYCIVPDVPGFVVNHMLFSMLTTAINLVQEEGLEPKIIDDAVTRSRILVTGPFKVADFVGLDTCLRVLTQIHERTGQPRFEPPALLEQKVMAGELGVKSGRGFYVYDEP